MNLTIYSLTEFTAALQNLSEACLKDSMIERRAIGKQGKGTSPEEVI